MQCIITLAGRKPFGRCKLTHLVAHEVALAQAGGPGAGVHVQVAAADAGGRDLQDGVILHSTQYCNVSIATAPAGGMGCCVLDDVNYGYRLCVSCNKNVMA